MEKDANIDFYRDTLGKMLIYRDHCQNKSGICRFLLPIIFLEYSNIRNYNY